MGALTWARRMYPTTPSYLNLSDWTTANISNKVNSYYSVSAWTIGNSPVSGNFTKNSGTIRWNISANFRVDLICEAQSSYSDRYRLSYKVYCNNTLLDQFTGRVVMNTWPVGIGFVYSEADQKAYFVCMVRENSSGNGLYVFYISSNNYASTLYPYVKAAIDVQEPDWHAVNSVSGELGTFEFSKIAQDHINGGNAVTTSNPTYIERFISQTELLSMVSNLPFNTNTIVIYSGAHAPYQPGNYLRLTKSHYQTLPDSIYLAFTNEGVGFFSYEFIPVTGHKYYLSFLIDRNNHYGLLSIIDYAVNPISISYNNIVMSTTEMTSMYRWLLESDDSVTPEINKEEEPAGVNPWVPDDVDPLTAPTISAIDTGFTSMFQVTKTQLQDLSDFLWSDNFVDNVAKFFNDPREIIVGIAIMPVAPDVGTAMTIQAGGISTGIQGNPLTSQYKLMEDIGSVYIQKAKGNFLDYPPYTKCTVHLPFCGEHTLDVNDIMGKTLTLSYLFDFLSGSVVASIKVDGSTNYFFGGSCGMQVPSSSEDFGRMYSSILSAGATLGTALATVATGGMTAPLAIGAGAAMANNGMNMTPDVQHTSGSGSINGMLGNQSAYITMEIPNEKLAAHQNKFSGKMSLITSKIKNCTGYIKCFKVHTDGIKATLDERKEITSYMMNGFRRETGSTLPDLTPVTSGDTVILFMKCTSEEDVMGKTWEQTTLKLEGKMIYNQNILTPEFTIKGDISAYNYAYIPLFSRYYYIKSIVALSADAMGVKFQVDALQSFKAQIDECEVILERQETKSNSHMNDPEYWTVQDKQIIPKYFRTSGGNKVKFDRNNNVFVLTIAGSNARTP